MNGQIYMKCGRAEAGILVDLSPKPGDEESAGAAFYVERDGNPRISSVEFENFCIDGLHFVDDGSGMPNPENTYTNGKTGIYIGSAQDSFRLTGMGIVFLEHWVTIYHADALSIHDNFIAECGNCIELRGWGQASKITDNLMGAGYKGYSIFAENFGGLLITANNIFPRGTSSVHFRNVARSIITANRFHSFYPGMLVFEGNSSENMVSLNHFLRDNEPWAPMLEYDNGLDDFYTGHRILDDGVTYTCIYRNMCCDPGVWRIAFCDFPVKNHKVQSRTTDTILCAGSNFIGCYLSDFYEIVFCNTNWCY
ncbi:MAG: NosD domain-containing protein [Blautia faecicola]